MFVFVIVLLIAICFLFHWLNNFFRKALMPDLVGKHVLITGTDTGFGRVLTLDLARRGFVVHAGCYTESGAQSLEADARDESLKTLKVLLMDVTKDDSVSEARKIVEKELPPGEGLWGLVNNAGIARGVVFEFASMEDYEDTMDVNFYGILRVTNAFLPLVKMARGRIVNVVSIVGRFSLVAGPYSCSKFAAQAYSDGLRRQLSSLGVKVSIIEPGFFPTNMTSQKNFTTDIDRSWAALPDDTRKAYGKEYCDKAKTILENQSRGYPLASGNRIHHVTDSIQHALSAVHPKARYVCGLDAHILYRPAANLVPDWIIDSLIGFVKELQYKRFHQAGSKLAD